MWKLWKVQEDFAVFAESLFWSSGLRIAQLRSFLGSLSRCCKIEALDRKSSYVWYTGDWDVQLLLFWHFQVTRLQKEKEHVEVEFTVSLPRSLLYCYFVPNLFCMLLRHHILKERGNDQTYVAKSIRHYL